MNGSDVVGEFSVLTATNVILEDGFPTTQVVLTPVRVSGVIPVVKTLILPGGIVDGVPLSMGGPEVAVGDVLFLFLRDFGSVWNVAYGFERGFYRRTETTVGPVMSDMRGRAVLSADCNLPLQRERTTAPSETTEAPEVPFEGGAAVAALSWDIAVSQILGCGGAE